MSEFDPKCFANHMGLYLIEPAWISQAVSAIRSGAWAPKPGSAARPVPVDAAGVQPQSSKGDDGWILVGARAGDSGRELYQISPTGVAVIQMAGPMMKGRSKFGGVSTIDTRMAVRHAARNREATAIVLNIDSPGGYVAGTQELADDVRAADRLKPVLAQISDLGASAAYWTASAARSISANQTAEVGSIGTVAVVEDSSGAAEMEGVKVHVVSTGPYKGAFVPGAEIDKKHLAHLQERVDGINAHFLGVVSTARGLKGAALAAVSDGRVWLADEAKRLGLIDFVQSLDSTMGMAAQIAADTAAQAESATRRASAEMRARNLSL